MQGDPQRNPHLLGVAELDRAEIDAILDRADQLANMNAAREPVARTMSDRTVINLFFEDSTRTQASFELAAKRLGATVMNMSIKRSSMSKGETLLDTATTLNAMLPDFLIVRLLDSGAVRLLAEKVNAAVVNAGDGRHEHPTQALLDALTIRRAFAARRGPDAPAARLEGLTLAIVGDVAHSRVARSNIFLLSKYGARIRVAAPPSLTPAGLDALGVETHYDISDAVDGADVVMALRLQSERMHGALIATQREYYHNYGLDAQELARAAPDALVMHPGPMNRGVEIDSELADDPYRSLIATQVQLGVAVRMAVMERSSSLLPHVARPSERDPTAKPEGRFVSAEAAESRPIVLYNARLVDPEAGAVEPGALLVKDGKIADLGPSALAETAAPEMERIDCAGAALAPGLIDMRVFIGEPGERHKESFGSGGEAAVAGGVTTIVTQPDTNPPVDDPALLEFITQRVYEESLEHAMPHVKTMAALTKGLQGKLLAEYSFLLSAGAIALSDGPNVIASAAVMRRCLETAVGHDALVACATQDPDLSADASATEGAFATRRGLPAAPAAAETMALKRDLALVELTGARYHAAQISTAASVQAIRRAKEAGLDVTAAVSAPHATLTELDIGDYRTFMKLSPPLRSVADQQAIVQGLADGVIDVMVSSHRPQTEEAKRRPFAEAASGAVGLETLLSASLELVRSGALDLPRLFDRLSRAPARILGLDGGRLARGAPADLVLFDPDAPRRINRYRLRSKSKNSPYDRRELHGRVLRTLVAGRVVFEGAEPGDSAG